MRHRVVVETEYEYVEPGTLTDLDPRSFFCCEVPEGWVRDRLAERLFAVGAADLHTICTEIDAWKRANKPQAADVDIRLRSVRVTVLTLTETEAMPWLFLKNPLRYYGRCLVVESETKFRVIERDEFGKRAQEDIPRMRKTLPPMVPLPTDELAARDIFGKMFLFYGDRLVTRRDENQPGTDYCGFDTYGYWFRLYRLNGRGLVLKKDQGISNPYAEDRIFGTDYIVSRDNGGTWDPDPQFDGRLLTDQSPVWQYP